MAPDKLRPGSSAAVDLWNIRDADKWEEALNNYDESVKIVSKNNTNAQKKLSKTTLIEDNKWRADVLPKLLKEQNHITQVQLERLMIWKLRRGVYRPTLMALIRRNPSDAVKSISGLAFSQVASVSAASNDAVEACKMLAKLQGVGPATASLVMSVLSPDMVPFMSDEAMDASVGLPRLYTLPQFIKFQVALAKKAKELGDGWNSSCVENALFACAMFAKYQE